MRIRRDQLATGAEGDQNVAGWAISGTGAETIVKPPSLYNATALGRATSETKGRPGSLGRLFRIQRLSDDGAPLPAPLPAPVLLAGGRRHLTINEFCFLAKQPQMRHCRFFSRPRLYEPGPAVRLNHHDPVGSVSWDDPIVIHIAKHMALIVAADANAVGERLLFMQNPAACAPDRGANVCRDRVHAILAGMNTYTVTSCGNGWFQVTVLSQEGESHIRNGFVSEFAARKWVNRRLRSEAKQESAIADGHHHGLGSESDQQIDCQDVAPHPAPWPA